jgi:hypothetical protein
MDAVDPSSNPFGHLLVDGPEYLAGAIAAFIVGRDLGTTVYNMCKKEGNITKHAAIAAEAVEGYIAGSAAGNLVLNVASSLKKKRSE